MKAVMTRKTDLMLGLLLVISFLVVSLEVSAKSSINNVRMWLAPEKTRLVFDLTGPVKHSIFSLSNPDRVVLDIKGTDLSFKLDQLSLNDSGVKKIRAGKGQPLRLVLDLSEKMKPTSFSLTPNNEYGHRLVVDLARSESPVNDKQKKAVVKPVVQKEAAITPSSKVVVSDKPVKRPVKPGKKLRDIVIALDAGHGGEDPGAIGASGLREKVVVLAIAKELEKLIDKEYGFISRMIRRNDYYVSLRGRTSIARKKNADLFVSIHADAFKNKNARGASVWVLSNKGATSEVGRWLAQRENSSDLIGGVGNLSLEDKDQVLKGVLLDMSMTATRNDSREVATKIHKNIGKFAKMHKSRVERAGFLVLKSPDIPSILVETGFISNPSEERSLKSTAYRKKMARAIFVGIKEHFMKKPPAFTEIYRQKYGEDIAGNKEYKVVSGDSLSRIAIRYGVKSASIRDLNKLKGDKIRIGQKLQIPAS
jgi:N-acetylmuramoyl-L-alanine amidase